MVVSNNRFTAASETTTESFVWSKMDDNHNRRCNADRTNSCNEVRFKGKNGNGTTIDVDDENVDKDDGS